MLSCATDAIANCEAPPPLGSTATQKWLVADGLSGFSISVGTLWIIFLKKASMSLERKARSEESADMPCAQQGCEKQAVVAIVLYEAHHRFPEQHGGVLTWFVHTGSVCVGDERRVGVAATD